jgi:hypothetical protein
MHELATRYNTEELKDLTAWKFEETCKGYWNDHAFGVAARYIFTDVPKGDKLKDVVCQFIAHRPAMQKKPEIESLISDFHDLAVRLLKAKADK